MREGGGRRRVREIVCRHIDGLHGRDGPLLGGRDALLQAAQVSGEGGLVPHGRGDAAQQSRHLGVGLGGDGKEEGTVIGG